MLYSQRCHIFSVGHGVHVHDRKSLITIIHFGPSLYYMYLSALGSLKDKNRSSYMSSVTTSGKRGDAVSKKSDPLSPAGSSCAAGRHRGRRSRRGQEEMEREGGDWSNLPASNLPEDWGREKEVTEEKQTSTGNQRACTICRAPK